jgi:hypothetical protein
MHARCSTQNVFIQIKAHAKYHTDWFRYLLYLLVLNELNSQGTFANATG